VTDVWRQTVAMGMALFVVAIQTMVGTPGYGTAGQAVVLWWCSMPWSHSQRQVPAVAEVLAGALAVPQAGCREGCSGGQLQHHRVVEALAMAPEAFHVQKAHQLAILSPGWMLWQAPLSASVLAAKRRTGLGTQRQQQHTQMM